MAFPTSVNDQITDSVTQSNVKVVAEAPAVAMGSLYQTTAQSLSMSYENAVSSQQQATIASQAVTTALVKSLLGK